MRFSLRSLIVASLLVAGVLLATGSFYGLEQERRRLAKISSELSQLEPSLLVDFPQRHQALVHSLHNFSSLRSLREQATSHVESIRNRYSGIERRGPDVLTIRTIPGLRGAQVLSSHEFKLFVPESRPVWLKFGVHPTESVKGLSNPGDEYTDWLTSSVLSKSGPIQFQLPPGELLLTTEERLDKNMRVISISVDQNVVFETQYVPRAPNVSTSTLSASSQVDFEPEEKLPWLLTCEIATNLSTSTAPNADSYSIWLSGQPSQFEVVKRVDNE
ncbi:MAG: hypothetical protein JNL67_16125 [Planctomycetaceae bacterium]|nr:hypothetical protein [Planctomycetaceae bacterium]